VGGERRGLGSFYKCASIRFACLGLGATSSEGRSQLAAEAKWSDYVRITSWNAPHCHLAPAQRDGQCLSGHDLFLKRVGAAYHAFIDEVRCSVGGSGGWGVWVGGWVGWVGGVGRVGVGASVARTRTRVNLTFKHTHTHSHQHTRPPG